MSDIRDAIRDFSLSRSEGPEHATIRALYAAFDEHNTRFWDGAMLPVPILISPPVSAKAIADAAEFSAFGCRQQLRIRPSCASGTHPTTDVSARVGGGWRMRREPRVERDDPDLLRWLSDVVLHEMVHLWLNQIEAPGRHEHKGHGEVFTAECNRIGAMLDLREVRSRRRKGDPRELPISPDWPFCVRPGGYHGAFYGTLWERVDGRSPDEEAPATQLDKLIAIWEAEETTDADRAAFMREYGPVAVTVDGDKRPSVAINGDARPSVTADDDTGQPVTVDGDARVAPSLPVTANGDKKQRRPKKAEPAPRADGRKVSKRSRPVQTPKGIFPSAASAGKANGIDGTKAWKLATKGANGWRWAEGGAA